MSELTDALALRRVSEGEWIAHADPRYVAVNSMYGGWTAAVTLGSVVDDRRRLGEPVAITVNYTRAVRAGRNVVIRAQPVSGGRSTQHWQIQLFDREEPQLLAQAMAITATRRATDGFTEHSMPEAPDPHALDEVHPPGEFGKRVLVRPVFGVPFLAQRSTTSLLWVREISGRRIDAVQLAFLSDAYPPRILYVGEDMRVSLTLTLSVYFHATVNELEAVGDDYILNQAVGTRGAEGTVGQQARLWSPQGALLATTEQLCWYQ
jgi:acyl-coenzyme A thioesterase PaaI-like protein